MYLSLFFVCFSSLVTTFGEMKLTYVIRLGFDKTPGDKLTIKNRHLRTQSEES